LVVDLAQRTGGEQLVAHQGCHLGAPDAQGLADEPEQRELHLAAAQTRNQDALVFQLTERMEFQ
jgi:hypothetical protein